MNTLKCLAWMQVRFLKIISRNFRRAPLMSAAVACFIAFGKQQDPAFAFGFWLLMIMNTVASLKTRERQEDWLQFYMAGNFSSPFVAGLMPIFIPLMLGLAVLTALIVAAVAGSVFGQPVHVEPALLLSIANAAWFYGNFQNVLMQIVALDKIMSYMRLSIVVLFVIYMAAGELSIPAGSGAAIRLAMLAANIGLAYPASVMAYRHSRKHASARKIGAQT